MTATAEPAPINEPVVDARKAEGMASYLCHFLMTYASAKGLSTEALARRSGVSIWTIRGLRHRKIRNYPQLLNFVKLLAAADLEVQIVRARNNLTTDPNKDPKPPTAYLTGTEGNLRWPI